MEEKTLYVLLCEEDKYYVGTTTNLDRRLEEHKAGRGSAWTKKYPVVRVVKVEPVTSRFDENNAVREYMDEYGIPNVRGGSYSQITLPEEQVTTLKLELAQANDLCFACHDDDHFVSNCPRDSDEYDSDDDEQPPPTQWCKSCGGDHNRSECQYKRARCRSCGNVGHLSHVCFSRRGG